MSAPASRLKATAFWVFKLLFALLFIATASAKLTGQPMMVKEFDIIGFGQWFRLFTGAVEALSAVLLLIPRSSQLGAAGMFLISVGAFVAQTAILHMDVIHTIVLAIGSAALIWLSRNRSQDARAA